MGRGASTGGKGSESVAQMLLSPVQYPATTKAQPVSVWQVLQLAHNGQVSRASQLLVLYELTSPALSKVREHALCTLVLYVCCNLSFAWLVGGVVLPLVILRLLYFPSRNGSITERTAAAMLAFDFFPAVTNVVGN